jgi:hypothetical protein
MDFKPLIKQWLSERGVCNALVLVGDRYHRANQSLGVVVVKDGDLEIYPVLPCPEWLEHAILLNCVF